MRDDSPQWEEVGPPATPAEAAALAAFKRLLPDSPMTWAWANVSFLDTHGRHSEVDVIVLTRSGLFLVELKGYHGRIGGNQVHWRLDDGKEVDNPIHATQVKSKRLRGLLQHLASGPGKVAIPFIKPIVVLHGKDSKVELDDIAKTAVFGLDDAKVEGVPTVTQWLSESPKDIRDVVDKAKANQIVQILKSAGFKAIPKNRMIGEYAVDRGEPFSEGPAWRDVIAEHQAVRGLRRRIRLYDLPLGIGAEQRAAIKRAAQRELLLTQGMDQPGIVKPLEFIDSELGPALVFEHDSNSEPLADYVAKRAEHLTFDERIRLVRLLGEVLQYAHSRRVSHRALTPKQVYVLDRQGKAPLVTVRDWQTGRGTTDTVTPQAGKTVLQGTRHIAGLAAHDGWIYLAPEVHTAQEPDGVALDVFSLGAIAYLIVTGRPPATSHIEFERRMREEQGLDPGIEVDGVHEGIRELILRATHPDPRLDRTPSVEAFLSEVDAALNAMREEQERGRALDPLDAQHLDLLTIAGRDYLVEERLGSGATGVALLLDDGDGRKMVLKAAHDAARGARLDDEYSVVTSLNHPRIVKTAGDLLDIAGRRCLLLEDAGRPTLGARIRDEGRLTLDQLERYGRDLLEAVSYLEQQGVFHRDIKPDNLGVRPDAGDRRPRPVLFDFSLSKEPLEHVKAGTPPYLDPFLGGAGRPRYDRAAERWAVAVTLYAMATGQVPQWGAGDADPATITDEVTMLPSAFETSVADAMMAFFAKALARDVSRRFNDLSDMAQAWVGVFRAADTRVGDTSSGSESERQEANDAAAAAATLTTPLDAAGLSARARSVAARLDATTVGELLAVNPMRINQVPGSGEATRRELQRRVREWRRRLAVAPAVKADEPVQELTVSGRAVDVIAKALVPQKNQRNATSVAAAQLLIGVPVEYEGSARYVTPQAWPRHNDIARVLGVTRVRVQQIVDELREPWSGKVSERGLAEELASVLESLGGVAELGELARSLLATHGSSADEPIRSRQACGVIRVILESEERARGGDSRFAYRRIGDRIIVASTASPTGVDVIADEVLDFVKRIGTTADRFADRVVPRAEAVVALRAVPAPASLALSEDRLLHVAAAASAAEAVSARGELYPRGLAAATALRLTLSGVALRTAVLTPEVLAQRVKARFPEAQPLPSRPALDQLVEGSGLNLKWSGQGYVAPTNPTTGLLPTVGLTQYGKDLPHAQPYDEVDVRLRQSLANAAYVTLAVDLRHVDRAASALAQRYGVSVVDLTAEMLKALHSLTEGKVDWSLVLGSDARPPGDPERSNLDAAVRRALNERLPSILERPEPLLLINPGPLGRYRAEGWIATLSDLTTDRPAARWMLAPHREVHGAPVLDDGVPLPLGTDGWLALPPALTRPDTTEAAS